MIFQFFYFLKIVNIIYIIAIIKTKNVFVMKKNKFNYDTSIKYLSYEYSN